MKNKSLNPPRIILRTDQKNKDGKCSVIIRLIIHNIKKDISLKVYCHEQYFDKINKRLKRTCADSERLNLLIDSSFKHANDIIYDARLNRRALTMNEFMAMYAVDYGESNDSNNFYKFIEREIEIEKKKTDKSQGTIAKYGYNLRKLKLYRPNLTFRDITTVFLADLIKYETVTLGNQKNSVNNTLKFIKRWINEAKKQGLTTNSTFDNFKIKNEIKDNIKYLDIEEANKLKDYFTTLHDKHPHYRALKSFLFSCYTGLRYGDNSRFTLNDVVNDSLKIRTEKTKAFVSVPLLSAAKELLNYDVAVNLPNLNTPSNQKCNYVLKEIATICNIPKPISTHYARHTFGCIAVNNGVQLSIIQAVMGHATSKQTELYAKIFDTTIVAGMAKLEGIY